MFEWSSPTPEATNDISNTLSICNKVVFDTSKKDSFYCWIDLKAKQQAILPLTEENFTFNFILHIEHESNTYQQHFKANFWQIKQIYNIAKKRNECFASRVFPLYIDFKRPKALKEQMYLIEEHMFLYDMLQANIPIHHVFVFVFLRDNDMLTTMPQYQDIINIIAMYSTIAYTCQGPTKSKWFSKKCKNPTIYDGYTLRQILNKLFNAPLFALRNDLYKCLKLGKNVKSIVQLHAGQWLNILKEIYGRSFIKVVSDESNDLNQKMTYKKLITDIRYKHIKFHFAFAVQDPNASFTHWLLKFEGNNNLLTVDWCRNSSILVSVLQNTAIEQRIFWYSCQAKEPSFTKRYAIWSKCLMPQDTCITGSDIGNLIHKWINKNPEYNGLVNNCQHFVRDMLLVINESEAKKLTKQLQTNNVGFLDPLAGANNSRQQKERERSIKQLLGTELIRCKNFRENNSQKLKKLLDETKLTGFYNALLDAGYYDADYHTLNDNELNNIGMRGCDRMRFLDGKPFYLKEFLRNVKLDRYYDSFIESGYNDSDVNVLSRISMNELKNKIKMTDDHCQQFRNEMNKTCLTQEKIDEMQQLKSWLKKIQLPDYYDIFIQNGFESLHMIQHITEEVLIQMKISMLGHRMQIMAQLETLKLQKTSQISINDKKTDFISNPTDDSIDDATRNCIEHKISEKKSDLHMNAKELLKHWGLAKFAGKMIEEGWNDPLDWIYFKDDSGWDLNDLGFNSAQKRKFVGKYEKWLQRKQTTK